MALHFYQRGYLAYKLSKPQLNQLAIILARKYIIIAYILMCRYAKGSASQAVAVLQAPIDNFRDRCAVLTVVLAVVDWSSQKLHAVHNVTPSTCSHILKNLSMQVAYILMHVGAMVYPARQLLSSTCPLHQWPF